MDYDQITNEERELLVAAALAGEEVEFIQKCELCGEWEDVDKFPGVSCINHWPLKELLELIQVHYGDP